LRYAANSLPSPLEELTGHLLAFQFRASITAAATLPIQGIVFALVLLILLIRPRWLIRKREGGILLRDWFSGLIWALLTLDSFLLDLNPLPIPLYTATALLVALGASQGQARGHWANWRSALGYAGLVAALIIIGPLPTSGHPLDAIYIASWLLLAVPAVEFLRRRLLARDALALVLTLGLFHQISFLLVGIIADFGEHDSRRTILGELDAYSFCETSDAKRLFAVLPTCTGGDVDSCREDQIAQYDLEDLSLERLIQPFDENHAGRMLHLLCLEESLLVGMADTRIGPSLQAESVMEINIADGSVLRESVVGPYGGHRLLLHPDGTDVFVASEYSSFVLRQALAGTDRPTRTEPAPPEALLIPRSSDQVRLNSYIGSVQTEINAVRAEHGHGFFAEWLSGYDVYEIDLDTGGLIRSFRVNDGGTHSLAVDEELNRLIVTSLWGVAAIDLESGAIVARRRTEFGPRLPLIDVRRDLIFITPTFGNQVWVLDRRTLEVVEKLPSGAGGRNGHLSSDGRYLFTGGGGRHVAWQLD